MTTSLADWEHSKENIQPLKQGRDPTKLSEIFSATAPTADHALLAQQQTARTQKLNEERQEFERRLQSVELDDVLEIWVNYINWAQQSFPSDGRQKEILLPLLERATRTLIKETKYHGDVRYLRLWLLLVDQSRDPGEVFSYLESNRIGYKLALFYEGWGHWLESRRDFIQAEIIYQKGVARHAEPFNRLQRHHKEFQDRVAKKALSSSSSASSHSSKKGGSKENDGDGVERGRERKPLGVASSSRIPIIPTASSSTSSFSSASMPNNNNNNATKRKRAPTTSASFTIFTDDDAEERENDENLAKRTQEYASFAVTEPSSSASSSTSSSDPSVLPPYDRWRVLPPEQERHKENLSVPTAWANQKLSLPSSSSSRPSSSNARVSSSSKGLPFTIFSDDGGDQLPDVQHASSSAVAAPIIMPSKKSTSRSSSSSSSSSRPSSSRKATSTTGAKERFAFDSNLLISSSSEDNKEQEVMSFEEQKSLLPRYFFDPKLHLQKKEEEEEDNDVDMEIDEEEEPQSLLPLSIPALVFAPAPAPVLSILPPSSLSLPPLSPSLNKLLSGSSSSSVGNKGLSFTALEYGVPTQGLHPIFDSSVSSSSISTSSVSSSTGNREGLSGPLSLLSGGGGGEDQTNYFDVTITNHTLHMPLDMTTSNFTGLNENNTANTNTTLRSLTGLGGNLTGSFKSIPRKAKPVNSKSNRSVRHALSSAPSDLEEDGETTRHQMNEMLASLNTPLQRQDQDNFTGMTGSANFLMDGDEDEDLLVNTTTTNALNLTNNTGNLHNNKGANFLVSDILCGSPALVPALVPVSTTLQSQIKPPSSVPFQLFWEGDDENSAPSLSSVSAITPVTPVSSGPSVSSLLMSPCPIFPSAVSSSSFTFASPSPSFSLASSSSSYPPPLLVTSPVLSTTRMQEIEETLTHPFFVDCTGSDNVAPCGFMGMQFVEPSAIGDATRLLPSRTVIELRDRDRTLLFRKLITTFSSTILLVDEVLEMSNTNGDDTTNATATGLVTAVGNDNKRLALKLIEGTTTSSLEIYIQRQVLNRVTLSRPTTDSEELGKVALELRFGGFESLHKYDQRSALLMQDYREHFTLEALLKAYSSPSSSSALSKMKEAEAIFYTIDLLRSVGGLHRAGIAHNSLGLQSLLWISEEPKQWENWRAGFGGGWSHKGLRLIDFSRSVDSKLFPTGTQFNGEVPAPYVDPSLRQRIQNGRNWTVQGDLLALVDICHRMLRNTVSLSVVSREGRWKLSQELNKREQDAKDIWDELFDSLLNCFPSSSSPSSFSWEQSAELLSKLQNKFEAYLLSKPLKFRDLKYCLSKQKITLEENAANSM